MEQTYGFKTILCSFEVGFAALVFFMFSVRKLRFSNLPEGLRL